MGKRAGKTNTGESDQDKRVRTTSDDAGEKSVSEKSGKCVSENSTWVTWCDTDKSQPVRGVKK
jgi:hypothetical protein